MLRDVLRDLLEKPPIPLAYIGLKKLTLETLTLGGQPPKCGGVKVVKTDKEEVVIDVEAKLAGARKQPPPAARSNTATPPRHRCACRRRPQHCPRRAYRDGAAARAPARARADGAARRRSVRPPGGR